MSAYDQNSLDFCIFAEMGDGKTCMSHVVFEMITNPKAKTWPRPMDVHGIKDKPGGKT